MQALSRSERRWRDRIVLCALLLSCVLVACDYDLSKVGRPCGDGAVCPAGQTCTDWRCTVATDARTDQPLLDARSPEAGSLDGPGLEASASEQGPGDGPKAELGAGDGPKATKVRLLQGSFGLTGPVTAGQTQLLEGSFEAVGRVCQGNVCVTGGVLP